MIPIVSQIQGVCRLVLVEANVLALVIRVGEFISNEVVWRICLNFIEAFYFLMNALPFVVKK